MSFTIPFDRECSLHCHGLKTYLVKIVQQMIDYCRFINTLVVQLIFGSGLDEWRFPLSLTALLFFCLQNSGFPLTRMACSVYTKDCYLAPLSIRPVPPWTPFTIRACKDGSSPVEFARRLAPRLPTSVAATADNRGHTRGCLTHLGPGPHH